MQELILWVIWSGQSHEYYFTRTSSVLEDRIGWKSKNFFLPTLHLIGFNVGTKLT